MTLFDQVVREKHPAVQALADKMIQDVSEGWKDIFRGCKDILYNIADELYRKIGSETVCPASGDVFNAFKYCKYNDLKVVWVLQDPYHQVVGLRRVADGIAMSCSNTGKLQPSLSLVYEEIERTVHVNDRNSDPYIGRNPDLRPWAHQGILMMNTALTVQQGNPGSHTQIWRPFTQYLLKELSLRSKNIIYIFAGANAKSFRTFVRGNTEFALTHPASAAYKGGRWDCDDVFNNVNKMLEFKGLTKIKW